MKNLKLAGYRMMCDCTQEDFSDLLGMKTRQGYALKEAGKVPFTAREMLIIKNKINDALGLELTIDELFY